MFDGQRLGFLIASLGNTFNNHWLETLKVAKTESLKSPITNLALESYSETVSFISHPPNLSTYLIFILMLSSHHSFLANFIFEKFSKCFSTKILRVLCPIVSQFQKIFPPLTTQTNPLDFYAALRNIFTIIAQYSSLLSNTNLSTCLEQRNSQ